MKKFFRNVLFLSAGVLEFVSILSLVLVVAGFRPFVLGSDSMAPLYRKGSLVWVDTKVGASEIHIGDVVVHRAEGGELVMHRLVALQASSYGRGPVAFLQGDANPTQERVELSGHTLVGREAFTLSGIGFAVAFLNGHRPVFLVLIGLLVLLACWPKRHSEKPEY